MMTEFYLFKFQNCPLLAISYTLFLMGGLTLALALLKIC